MGEGPPRSSIVRAHYRLATVLRWRYSSLEREWGGGGQRSQWASFLSLQDCLCRLAAPTSQTRHISSCHTVGTQARAPARTPEPSDKIKLQCHWPHSRATPPTATVHGS
jgi:hypothetical protein